MFKLEEAITINPAVTTRGAILAACREIVAKNGLAALNMRAVAQVCQVALGSLYNYFPSKDSLVLAAIESVWQDIFRMEHRCGPPPGAQSFLQEVCRIFESVQKSAQDYPNFFTAHSLSVASAARPEARAMMDRSLAHIKAGMAQALAADTAVPPGTFSADFQQADFLDFVLNNLLSLLVQRQGCGVLLQVIRRTLYPR